MAMAFLILGGSLARYTCFADDCCVLSSSWVICLRMDGFSLSL